MKTLLFIILWTMLVMSISQGIHWCLTSGFIGLICLPFNILIQYILIKLIYLLDRLDWLDILEENKKNKDDKK